MKNKVLKDSDILYQDIEYRIERIKNKKNLNYALHRSVRMLVFIGGACVTVLSGINLDSGDHSNTKYWALSLSAVVTFLASFEGLFLFKDKGRNHELILFDLRKLRDRICFEYAQKPELYQKNKENHFNEYQLILENQKQFLMDMDTQDD